MSGLDLRRVRPAEPGLVAAGVERGVGRRVDAVGAGVPGVEDVPAALGRRVLLGPAGADRAPIERLVVHVHADLAQQVGGHVALRLGDRDVGGDQQHDLLALVARLGQQLLGLVIAARALQDVAARLRVDRRAGREEARQRLPQRLVVADDGAHVVFLAQRHHHGPARAHVVERRVEVVDAERADVAERVGDVDVEVAVALEQRHQVGDRVLPPIDLAVLQRGRLGGVVRQDQPLDAVEHHALAAGEPVGRLRRAARSRRSARTRRGCPAPTRPS